ncbi:DUF421 domain-containing protein [Heyndrickxia oleronia]|uniref:DUF421 domain-containing protein n=1 Tax=Heyndrickxia oleronia TaxID=38875 RepID=A0AAW6STR3_9BACI|nr:DUF421 domain-containing protein [Heyndrickxia oleronia]MDH5160257.1 DUF421 domain-containing protein [Heyndrickxia oleronia]
MGLYQYFTIGWKTVILYLLILVIFRLMGKREIGELSVLDLVIFIMIGELAAVAIENHAEPIGHTILPMVILLGIQVFFALISLKSPTFRKMIDGTPSIVIRKGKIDEKAMKRQRYNFDDLLMQLRQKDINNIADVEYAILETSGELSIVKKDKKKKQKQVFTLPFIVDGEISHENLANRKVSEMWLRRELRKRGYSDINQISFCSFQDGEFYIDLKDELE